MLGTNAQLAAVVAVAAGCDALRDDTGLIAAIFMGLAAANLRGFDIPARRPFFETLVQLIIGVLFISISATVTPQSLRHLILPTLVLVAVLVIVARPIVAFASTLRTDLPKGERAFIGWMAPRGIVAAATASTFTAALVAKGIGGASKILPATFLVIVATVTLYGLTAAPVARRLHVGRPARTRPLLVGGNPWVIDLGLALQSAGLEVLMWAGRDEQREQIRQAGLELAAGELLAAATGRGARLEGITAVLLLTDEDDFNALAAVLLATSVEGRVYRLAPQLRSHGVVAPYTGGEILFSDGLTRRAVSDRYAGGARIIAQRAGGEPAAGNSRPQAMTCCSWCARTGSLRPLLRPVRRCRRRATPRCPWGRCRSTRRPMAGAQPPARTGAAMTFHVRLVSPPDQTERLVGLLAADSGVANLVVLPGMARRPDGDAVQFDVRARVRELRLPANWRPSGLGHSGAVGVKQVDATLGAETAPAPEALYRPARHRSRSGTSSRRRSAPTPSTLPASTFSWPSPA